MVQGTKWVPLVEWNEWEKKKNSVSQKYTPRTYFHYGTPSFSGENRTFWV